MTLKKYFPFVSIIMPAKNAAKYIEEAIESFLNQSYKNSELIIINDGSTDETEKIVCLFKNEFPERIKIIKNQISKGIPISRNKGLNIAKGELIGHLDSDDRLHKNAIKKLVKAFSKDKAIVLAHSGYIKINGDGEKISKHFVKNDGINDIIKGWQHFGLYKKDIALNIGGFNEKLITCSDGDLFVKIAKGNKIKPVNKKLYFYRWHESNIGHKRKYCPECDKKEYCQYYSEWANFNKFKDNH